MSGQNVAGLILTVRVIMIHLAFQQTKPREEPIDEILI
jgi:hypothetical protein